MRVSPLPFSVFFAVILRVALERFSENADIHVDLSQLKKQP